MDKKNEHMEETNYQEIKVMMSDGNLITGKVNVINFLRFSDMMKHSTDKFLLVVSENMEDGLRCVYLVNKEHIMWAKAFIKEQ